MVTIRNQLVSSRAVTSSGTNPRRYITIHETANTARGANAQAHANLQSNGFSASWHITVDDTQAIRSYPDTVRCWHAGDGSGHGNMSSIGIEICVNSDGNFTRAKANAAAVVRQLRAKYNIPRSRVVQHNHWSGKNCPTNLRRSGWAAFLASTDPSGGSSVSRPTFVSPAEGRVSSEWGARRHPISGKAGWHRGIDIANSTGTPIYAAYGGKVRQANTGTGTNPITGVWNTGRSIIINGPGGGSEFYGHLQSINVRVGQQVRAGDRIATMGATGNVTGPHLHFECWSGRNQGGGAGAGNTRNPRTDFNKHGITPGSRPVTSTPPETPKEPLMSARDYWRWVGQDFVNKNATSKEFQVARAYQRSNQVWARIRSTVFRDWLARGTWRNFRGQDFVNASNPTTKDFQLARAYQYSYENNGKLDRLLSAVEGMSAGLDEALGEDRSHIYEAVRAALEDHDQRQVQVDVNITDAPQDDDDQALILAGDDDPTGDDSDHDQENED